MRGIDLDYRETRGSFLNGSYRAYVGLHALTKVFVKTTENKI